jgi:hypothetical protein
MFGERLNKARLRMRALWRRRQLDGDLQDEVAFHLAMREEKNRAAGARGDEARYAARRQFGNVSEVKENPRNVDLRFA